MRRVILSVVRTACHALLVRHNESKVILLLVLTHQVYLVTLLQCLLPDPKTAKGKFLGSSYEMYFYYPKINKRTQYRVGCTNLARSVQ